MRKFIFRAVLTYIVMKISLRLIDKKQSDSKKVISGLSIGTTSNRSNTFFNEHKKMFLQGIAGESKQLYTT